MNVLYYQNYKNSSTFKFYHFLMQCADEPVVYDSLSMFG